MKNYPLTNKVEFEREDFTDEQFNMLKMMFGMAEQMAYRMGQDPYYDHSFSNTFFELKEKLGVLDLVD